MFTKKNFKEVFESIKQHKTRNYLTGFGVSWGILVLLVMLGAGEAFRVGIGSQFGGFAQNSINFIGGQTSKANVGESVGRRIFFSEQLVYKLKERFSNELADISPVVFYQKRQNVFFGKNFSSPRITGVLDEFYNIRHFDIVAGRVLNPLDIAKKRKVIVINEVIKDELFDKGINPIGKSINIAGNWYRVIGVVKSDSMINQAYTRSLFMPYGTMKKYLRHGYRIGSILVGIADGEDALKAEKKIVKYLAKNLRFSINDKKAVTVQNLHQQMKQFDGLFTGMKVFVWFFGLCILLTAMIGVCNIMLVIVKERTREIGIRKALGAKSKDILSLVILESIVITVSAGVLGIITSFGMLIIINFIINTMFPEYDLVKDLVFNSYTSIVTFILLVISGAIAGYFPALKATKISPVNAIRYE